MFGINAQLKIIFTQTFDKAALLIHNGNVGLNQLRFDANDIISLLRLRLLSLDLPKRLLRTDEADQKVCSGKER